MSDEVWTIGRLLKWTKDYLGEHGAESPRLDAELLLAEARGCRRIELYTAFDEPASEQVRTTFRELVRRRSEGTPVAYLLGRREFYSLDFRVSPDVLIPRPETEFVIVSLLDRVKEYGDQSRLEILDVGTGSGILAVCAAKHISNSNVTAVDISGPALEIARANANEHGVSDQIEFVESDLLANLTDDQRYDFIISNPPYISESEMAELPVDVRCEPRVALAAGGTGTEVVARLIPQAAEKLRSGGWLIMEISPMIDEEVCELISADGRFSPPVVRKDLAQLPRVVSAQKLV